MRLYVRHHGARAFHLVLLVAALFGGTMFFASGSRADSYQIDTTSSWNFARTIGPFGYPNSTTYGQTITVPATTTHLNSFSLYMSLSSTLLVRGEVYAWDDTNQVVTGDALYESPQMHTDMTGVLQEITFNTGGIALTPGAKYILFATISKDFVADSKSGSGAVGFVGSDVYADGGFFFNNDGGDPSQWTTSSTWHGFPSDLAFTVNFAPPDTDLGVSAAPADVVTDATGPSGAVATYTPPTATDEDGAVPVGCSPASGSTFAIGTTTVSCSASDPDDANSPVSTSFSVTVKGAPQQLADLLSVVGAVGPGASLSAKVAAAQSYLSQANLAATCAVLRAFSAQVGAQSGKSIPTGTASTLIADAQRIGAVIGC